MSSFLDSKVSLLTPERRDEVIADSFAELRYQRELLRTKKHLATSLRLSMADIEVALRLYQGNLLYAARFLGVERSLLKRKVNASPNLQRLLQDLQEESLDEAEFQLMASVQEGHFPAVSMLLRTKGKERGYTERVTEEFEVGERTAAALIEAMRRGATPRLPEPKPEIEVEYEVESGG